MNRFFISPEQVQNGKVHFSPQESFQIRNVLRLKLGDRLRVLNNEGLFWEVELTTLTKRGVIGAIHSESCHPPRGKPRIILALALPSHPKMDWIVQKSTELGVDEILPFTCERAVRKEPGKTRWDRWKRIAKEAAEQSGKVYIPKINNMLSFPELVQLEKGHQLKLIFWEKEKSAVLQPILQEKELPQFENLLVAIGPEGGFEVHEIEEAMKAGFIATGLGENILRVETAALAVVSVIQFSLGRLG